MLPNLSSFNGYSHDVIFIDAIPGSGKSLLGPIVSSFHNVERQTMGLFTIEHLLAASYLGLCDPNLAQQLIQQLVSFNHYNMWIGRNTNMKISDISGPLSNPFRLRYILRLFFGSSGSDTDIKLLNNLNIAPLIKIHGCIYNFALLRNAFGHRLRFIELIRHPLDTFRPWINAQHYYRNGIRGFSLRLDNNHIVFDYLRDLIEADCCPLRQFNFLFDRIRTIHQSYSQDFLLLPFEYFLFDSKICTDLLAKFLSREPQLNQLRRSLRKQKCDRHKNNHIKSTHKKYQLYGGEPESLVISRDETLSHISHRFPSSDVKILIEHVEWYHEFINSFSF